MNSMFCEVWGNAAEIGERSNAEQARVGEVLARWAWTRERASAKPEDYHAQCKQAARATAALAHLHLRVVAGEPAGDDEADDVARATSEVEVGDGKDVLGAGGRLNSALFFAHTRNAS
jgi:hypothetical protein